MASRISQRSLHGQLLAWVLSGIGISAQASEPSEPVQLDYDAPSGCPDEGEFINRVQQKTSRFMESTSNVRRVFRISVQGTQPSMGILTVSEPSQPDATASGQRVVEGDTCDEVVSALALAVALAVDPKMLGTRAAPPETPPESTGLPKQEPTARAPSLSPQRETKPSTRWTVRLGAYGTAALGAAPHPLLGPGLVAEFADRPLHPAMVLRLNIEQGFSSAVHTDGATTDFSRSMARLDLCPLTDGAGAADVLVCGHGSLGLLQATSEAIPRAKHVVRPWAALGSSLVIQIVPSSAIRFSLSAGVDFALVRDKFVFQPDLEIHEVPLVSGFLAAAALYSLP